LQGEKNACIQSMQRTHRTLQCMQKIMRRLKVVMVKHCMHGKGGGGLGSEYFART
jgi:hypothetical protein